MIFTIRKRLHSLRAIQILTLQSPVLKSSSHLHGEGKENSQRKGEILQTSERDATRRSDTDFSKWTVRRKRRGGCCCCLLWVLWSKVVTVLSSRCVGKWQNEVWVGALELHLRKISAIGSTRAGYRNNHTCLLWRQLHHSVCECKCTETLKMFQPPVYLHFLYWCLSSPTVFQTSRNLT